MPEQESTDAVRIDLASVQAQASAEQSIPDKPMLGVDKLGNMTLFIPMAKTNEIFARGMVDMARSSILKWYVESARKQMEIQMLAQKTGFQRFKDKILAR